MKMQLRTPDKVVLERNDVLSFSGTLQDERRVTILPGHAPLLAILQKGNITVKNGKAQEDILIEESILKFRDDQIILYVLDEPESQEGKL
jgi:F0F1-type ATP synthase epsilon subunit